MNSRKPPSKKKNKSSKKPKLNTSLPDDLLLSCFARVSRLYYPTLSLVSKRFRSLLASPELYKTRSLLGRTESCLYVCLQFPLGHIFHWFTLCRRQKKKKKSSDNLLVPIPFPHSTQASRSSVVAVGSSIYSIGGFINNLPSSSVSVLDCQSHTWHQAPNMQVARRFLAANVVDGKIYVAGGRVNLNSSWIEVFDTKTQIWNYVSSPGREICGSENISSTEINGKICMYGGNKGVSYNPKDGTCEPVKRNMCKGWVRYSNCVINNVLFYYHEKMFMFKWYDTKARLWRNLKGLEGIMPKSTKDSCVKLADYGGKIAILWDKDVPSSRCENKVICCAVIAIERRHSDEIWGTVEWFDHVMLTVPRSCQFVRVLATTL